MRLSSALPAGRVLAVAVAVAAGLLAAGCGSGSGGDEVARPAPAASDFPQPDGRTIKEIFESEPQTDLVLSPAASVFEVGPNRYPFGVFEVDQAQVDDAEVALYFAKTEDSPEVIGPVPASVESLETKPAYRSQTVEAGGEARSYYVANDIRFTQPGPWLGIALVRRGNGFEASRLPSPVVGEYPGVVSVGEPAPRISTPTAQSVGGDLSKIDTRQPPSSMHRVDFKDVVGRKPVVIIFATPAFCQSRVCGPGVDVAEQVKTETGEGVEFIHMEVFSENDPNKGLRPQLTAFGLPTEPWVFTVGSDGKVVERVEGALGVREMREVVDRLKSYEKKQAAGGGQGPGGGQA